MASKFVPANEQLAQHVESNEFSLTKVPPGHVTRGAVVWNMEKQWVGRELQVIGIRKSNWTHTTRAFLGWVNHKDEAFTDFTVHLDYNLSKEEAQAAGEVYAMAINTRRI